MGMHVAGGSYRPLSPAVGLSLYHPGWLLLFFVFLAVAAQHLTIKKHQPGCQRFDMYVRRQSYAGCQQIDINYFSFFIKNTSIQLFF
jgi:hypothetical protein